RLAIAAVCWMERKDTGRSAGAQVLENGALDCVFRPTAMASSAHGRPRISASPSLARVKFTMSESEPSVRFSRYMPGKRLWGTMASEATAADLSRVRATGNRPRAILAAVEDR